MTPFSPKFKVTSVLVPTVGLFRELERLNKRVVIYPPIMGEHPTTSLVQHSRMCDELHTTEHDIDPVSGKRTPDTGGVYRF